MWRRSSQTAAVWISASVTSRGHPLEASLHRIISERNIAAENDYGARAETVTNPAYNILIAYADGRSLYITSEGQTLNEHEEDIEDALLTWADEAFATGGKQMP